MKILHVITSLRTGGAEKLMVDLLPRMQREGHQVDLCVFDGVRTPFYEELEEKGIRIFPLHKAGGIYSVLNIVKLIPLMKGYDIVHAHNTAAQIFSAMANGFVKTRLVTTEHNTNNRRRRLWWFRTLDKWMYKHFYKIICISEETKHALLDYLGKNEDDERFVVVYNGINVSNYSIPKKKGEGYTIMMIAAFRWEKDQKTVIRALEELEAPYHVWFVGGGDEKLIRENVNLSKELGVESRVQMLGVRNDIPSLLAQADVVVQSSFVDGFCLAAIEGMASGTPVVVSDIPGVGDIVRGFGVLFPVGDYRSLAREIKRLCENKVYAAQVAERCQQRARMFDIEVMVKKYIELYR